MILSELDVLQRLYSNDSERRITITPIISPRTQFGPASFDLRLGTEFKVFRESRIPHLLVNPKKQSNVEMRRVQDALVNSMDVYTLRPTDEFVLHPNQFVLGSTLEYIALPFDVSGILEGRSTWGRFGLQIHSTAGFVDPGFSGQLTFELLNMGSVPLAISPGLRLAQILFIRLRKRTAIPYGIKDEHKYQFSHGTVSGVFFEPRPAAPKTPQILSHKKSHKKTEPVRKLPEMAAPELVGVR